MLEINSEVKKAIKKITSKITNITTLAMFYYQYKTFEWDSVTSSLILCRFPPNASPNSCFLFESQTQIQRKKNLAIKEPVAFKSLACFISTRQIFKLNSAEVWNSIFFQHARTENMLNPLFENALLRDFVTVSLSVDTNYSK